MDLRAVIFVPALVAAAICVFFFLTFAANYYLTVLESTAAGAREVTWIPEGITDNFWKPFYLAWLLCLWLGPAYVIGRSLAGSSGAAWQGLAVPLFAAWMLYPVSQLSSLSASSVWIPIHPQVFARLAQKPAVTLGFFLFSLPVFALLGIAYRWAFATKDQWPLLFLGTPLLAFALLLYARLLGRLAFALRFTRDILKRKKKKKPKSVREEPQRPARRDERQPAIVQPSDMAPINTPDGELSGYNVLIADDLPNKPEGSSKQEGDRGNPRGVSPRKRVRAEVVEEVDSDAIAIPLTEPEPRTYSLHPASTDTDDDDDATPYETKPHEPSPEADATLSILKPSAEELALLDRSDAPKPPKAVWTLELFAFLPQPGTIAALVILSGLGTLAGAAVRVARMFNPVAGAS